ncbi:MULTISPECIES: glutamate 5-kinase [Pseudomonadota]|uniref:glutamate 5-kinase n=1 Tax=Pseudomonadota TaxID=1224 RepID=UPI00200FD8CD|nr:glutamate 5-kinase [Halomonas venusta]UQI42753.1 glutamate 5-kinase [Halomonas venusta]
MSLRDELQADIAEAFDDEDGLADAVTAFSCTREIVTGGYDPETGATPQTTTGYQGRGVFGGFRQFEIDGARIMATDTKLTVLQNEIWRTENGEVTTAPDAPQIDDVINDLTVMDVKQDPAKVSWICQLRRT